MLNILNLSLMFSIISMITLWKYDVANYTTILYYILFLLVWIKAAFLHFITKLLITCLKEIERLTDKEKKIKI